MRDGKNDFSTAAASTNADYIVVKAEEDGVTVIGITRGLETRFLHTEKLDEGEVWISQFTEHASAVKIRGLATIVTKHGVIKSGRSYVEKS